MQFAAWVIGSLIKLILLGSISSRGWVRALPCFTALLFLGCCQDASSGYWQVLLGDQGTAGHWYERIGIVCSIARAAAFFEAFRWFVFSLPDFKRYAWPLVFIGSLVGAIASVPAEVYSKPSEVLLHAIGGVERVGGVALAIAMVAAWLVFEVIGGVAKDARAHAAVLVAWAIAGALAWVLIGQRQWTAGGWILTGAEIVLPLVWLSRVQQAPTWIAPEPLPKRLTEEQINAEFEQVIAKAKKATSGR